MKTPPAPLRSNFNTKNYHFSDDFPVIFLVYSYYVALWNDTNYQLNNRVSNVYIIYLYI